VSFGFGAGLTAGMAFRVGWLNWKGEVFLGVTCDGLSPTLQRVDPDGYIVLRLRHHEAARAEASRKPRLGIHPWRGFSLGLFG
jgi:hypothetical protein